MYFLDLLMVLRRVLLQDAVVLQDEYPSSPFFHHHLFQSEAYKQFAAATLSALKVIKTPTELELERVIPEYANRMDVRFSENTRHIEEVRQEFRQSLDTLRVKVHKVGDVYQEV